MLLTTSELATHLGKPGIVVFDCRHDLMDHHKGRAAFDAGHLPGAFFASVETDLAGKKNGANGRHPLPKPETFAAFLSAHGVTPHTLVVAYDDAGGLYAARLWWMARWIGHERVALLDGGVTQWIAEGRPLSKDASTPVSATVPLTVRVDTEATASVEELVANLGNGNQTILDARAAERYRGETETIDPVAGHIPGALNRFYRANLNKDLTFRPAHELRAEFLTLLGGAKPQNVVHQCGSGITACANLFAMERAGLSGSRLYAGSWSEWVSDPARPVAKG